MNCWTCPNCGDIEERYNEDAFPQCSCKVKNGNIDKTLASIQRILDENNFRDIHSLFMADLVRKNNTPGGCN